MGRSRFLDELDGCLARAMRQELDSPVALLVAEAGAFELMCGWYGYREMSVLLQQAELRLHARLQNLSATVGSTCLFERTGPASFAVALFGALAKDAAAVAQLLRTELQGPWKMGGELRELGFSIGFTLRDQLSDADTLHALARNALEQAMLQGGGVQATGKEESGRHERDRALGRHLPHAIGRRELHLEYQPIVALDRMAVVGVEALLRWNHPAMGRITPSEFVPIAARAGILGELGEWVLRNACLEFAQLQRHGPLRDLTFLSVNVSRQNLADPRLPDILTSAVRAARIAPTQLLLEVTESELAGHPARAARTLRLLRSLGARIALDDFGVGHSSLSSLHDLPVDVLKLDRSFLCTRLPGRKSRDLFAIAHAMVDLARSVDLQVVVEGVETPEQLAVLRSIQCPLAQGYGLCRPVPAESLAGCSAGITATG